MAGGDDDEEDERKSRAALQPLLAAVGIREEDLDHPERITNVEMVLDDYCCMASLIHLPGLRSICLIQQAICKIEGLEFCVNLERLHLNENRIEVVEGLHKCKRLHSLYLCTNEIREIGEGLVGLNKLETFWIAENQLTNLRGVSHAPNLTDLNAARNQLTTTTRDLASNHRLRTVNLSDNRISSFREILGFARLSNLQELHFADPDWGENPICSLCNYQTYTAYHLPSLAVHDRMRIGEDEHLAAEAAFSKKRLFYNMRSKLVKRFAADGLRAARALEEECVGRLTQELDDVARAQRRLDAFAMAREVNPAEAQLARPDATEAAGPELRPAVEKTLKDRQLEIADTATLWRSLSGQVQEEKQFSIRSLLLELQTGGNLRMEQGSPQAEPWARNIEELVRNRFKAEDFLRMGVKDINVRVVTRIHNQSARIQFEEAIDRDLSGTQAQLEYLFYVPDPSRAIADIREVVGEGFGSNVGRAEGATPSSPMSPSVANLNLLTNAVSIAEVPRLEHFARTEVGLAVARSLSRAARSRGTPSDAALGGPIACHGTLLVCSAYLGEQRPDSPAIMEGPIGGDMRALWRRRRPSSSPKVSPCKGGSDGSGFVGVDAFDGGVQTVFRSRSADNQQKVWNVTQTDLVLPEYLVEFDYVYRSTLVQTSLAACPVDAGVFGAVLRNFTFYMKLLPAAAEVQAEPAPPPADQPWQNLPELAVTEKVEGKHLVSDGGPLALAGPAVLANVLVLNLHGRKIRRIDPHAFQPLRSLTTLLLSFNSISSVTCLPRVPSITHLDLASNILEKVDALGGLPILKRLDMSWNSLLSSDVVHTLARDVPQLEELDVTGNPMAREAGHKTIALARMKQLKKLDLQDVSPAIAAEARESDLPDFAALTEAMVIDRASASLGAQRSEQQQRAQRPWQPITMGWEGDSVRMRSLLDPASGPDGGCGLIGRVSRSNWRSFAESIDLSRMGLAQLCDFAGFSSLQRLNLCGNRLPSLQQVASCTALEELAIEDNAMPTLQGASSLANLRRLDAGCNNITDVLHLQRLTKLSQLSLEDNYVDSLDTFSFLYGLMELYLSNNLIEELRSVLMLKALPKLIILDLSGNVLCAALDYRLYTLFHLKKLKVLDGVPITAQEQQEAEDRFSGKLTMEMLEEKLGPAPACYNFRSVDLSGSSLRELGQLLSDDIFPSLRELNLDSNPFTEMRALGPLSKLLVLRMNRTRVSVDKGMLGDEESGGGIASLPHLQVLEIGHSGISDISHFAHFPLQSLRILHLPGNDISKLEGLSHLEQLRELVLDRNKVKVFDEQSFQGLKSLRELHVEDNGLRSLSYLAPLPRLRALYLSLNRVAELSELEKLRSLRHVVLIHLSQNPVARKPMYRGHLINTVSSIRVIDGKEVSDDEREKSEQMLAASDPQAAQMALGGAMYVFAEQAGGAGVLGLNLGQDVDAGPRLGQGAKPIVEGRSGQSQAAAERGANGPIVLMGQGLGDEALSRGGGAGQKPSVASLAAQGARSHSVPRHVGMDVRQQQHPPK